jgi:hypothetical protein
VEIPLECGKDVVFTDILYSEQFSFNSLISVPKLTKRGAEVTFSSNKVLVKMQGYIVASGTRRQGVGLFELD